MSETEKFVPASDIAELLGQSVRTIHKWSQDGNIPCYWVVSSWRYKRSEIDEWMKSNHRFNPSPDTWEEKVKICIEEISELISENERRELNLDQYSASSKHDQKVIDEVVKIFSGDKKYEINRRFKDREGKRITTLKEKNFEKGR